VKQQPSRADCRCEPITLGQIALRLGLHRGTITKLKSSHSHRLELTGGAKDAHWELFPEETWLDRWCWPHVVAPWARRTGRLRPYAPEPMRARSGGES
jgi:hypothetical protein